MAWGGMYNLRIRYLQSHERGDMTQCMCDMPWYSRSRMISSAWQECANTIPAESRTGRHDWVYMWCVTCHVGGPRWSRTHQAADMGWLRLVGPFKLYVSFAKEPYKRDCILQKKPRIWRSLLIVATPYLTCRVTNWATWLSVCVTCRGVIGQRWFRAHELADTMSAESRTGRHESMCVWHAVVW